MEKESDINDFVNKIIKSIILPMKLWQHSIAIIFTVTTFYLMKIFYGTHNILRYKDIPSGWALIPSIGVYKLFEYIFYRKIVTRGIVSKGKWAIVELVVLIIAIIIMGFIAPIYWM